ncbi:MAG: anti-sigma factor [Xanthobacteraceae bacterium]|nr:anti-sigma factor [Xanthobacteraceae bacterium]
MFDRDQPVTEEDLHAYVDGELAPERREAVEAWLAAHPDDTARVGAWRAQAESIRSRYGALASESVPARFDVARLSRRTWPWKSIAAAAAVAFLIGGSAGWFGRDMWSEQASASPFQQFTAEAVDAYNLYVVEVRHPVEVPASDADHLVQWLSKRVGYQLRAPDLEKLGLKLVGGRLLPGPTGPAAFFMYEGPSGDRYTIYCARSNAPDTALRYNDIGKATAVYWADNDIAYVVSGKGDRTKVNDVATAAYDQIDSHRTPAKSGG